jgi:hypothetical protein
MFVIYARFPVARARTTLSASLAVREEEDERSEWGLSNRSLVSVELAALDVDEGSGVGA